MAIAIAAAFVAAAARADTHRALIVGIGRYPPDGGRGARSGWSSLDGPVNDAEAMRDLLVARYGFRREDIVLLLDGDATRDAILSAFGRVLVEPARPGDVGVFFFAGHGSWMRNSLSREADRRDETIVPVDGRDIRDKELARLMAKAARRKLRLTAIFDSCHSGSIARGLTPPRGIRAIPPDPDADARDPEPAPTPGQSGVLVLSGAGEDQSAGEVLDDDGRTHGAFTAALLAVLRTAPAASDAESVLLRVRARLSASGANQVPVLDGPPERRRTPLFGNALPGAQARLMIPAGAIHGDVVELLAGAALGLAPGAILSRAGDTAANVRLRVDEVPGPSRSIARRVPPDGSTRISPGDLFMVERWTAPARAALRVYVGPAVAASEVVEVARALAPLHRLAGIHWVSDPSTLGPTHVILRRPAGWALRFPDGREEPLGARPTAGDVARRLAGARGTPGRASPCGMRPALYVRLPVTTELDAVLATGAGGGDPSTRTADEADALYVLAGRISASGTPEYAWVLGAGLVRPAPGSQPSPLPARSEWQAAAGSSIASAGVALDEAAQRVSRIRGWLTLEPPTGEDEFPYHLALRRQGGSALVPAGTVLRGGDTYEPVLVATAAALARGSAVRHVYVLVIESTGHITVLYPSDRVSVDNRFPVADPGQPVPAQIPLGERGLFRIGPPYGTDTYVLLATEEPIASLVQLEQDAVMRGGAPAPGGDALGEFLGSVGSARGGASWVPGGWSIDRVTATSVRR